MLVYTGVGVPDASFGRDGDSAVRLSDGEVLTRTLGAWSDSGGTLKGAAGTGAFDPAVLAPYALSADVLSTQEMTPIALGPLPGLSAGATGTIVDSAVTVFVAQTAVRVMGCSVVDNGSTATSAGSTVGSETTDYWRVALEAVRSTGPSSFTRAEFAFKTTQRATIGGEAVFAHQDWNFAARPFTADQDLRAGDQMAVRFVSTNPNGLAAAWGSRTITVYVQPVPAVAVAA